MTETLQLAVMPGRERSWVDGDDLLCGYVVRAADAAWATTPAQLVEAHGLAFPGSPFHAGVEALDILRFPATPLLRLIPATGPLEVEGGVTGEGFVDHPPFTGSGFVASADHVIPLWWLEPTRVPAGAELVRVRPDRPEELLATYANVATGWLPSGPTRFAPSDLVGTFATWHGHRVMADPLANGAVVVAAVEQLDTLRLTERGVWGASVPTAEVSDVHALRVTATWRDARVQLVRRFADADGSPVARVVYLGRDAFVAEALGMQKMDAGVYEASIPLSELGDVEGVQLSPVDAAL